MKIPDNTSTVHLLVFTLALDPTADGAQSRYALRSPIFDPGNTSYPPMPYFSRPWPATYSKSPLTQTHYFLLRSTDGHTLPISES